LPPRDVYRLGLKQPIVLYCPNLKKPDHWFYKMKLHMLEHDPYEGPTNIDHWAENRGHLVERTYLYEGQTPPSPDRFDWLIVAGGSPHVWEEDLHPWLAPEKKYIRQALDQDKLILGLCFGAQLLAEALGGRVFSNQHQEIGWYEVALTPTGRNSFLFKKSPDTFITFHWHSDHFTLPPGCPSLAASRPTPNHAFVCPGRPVVGLQFHPEYTRDLVRNYARARGREWMVGPYVAGREAVLERTEEIPDTYWLMEAILDNMVGEFGQGLDQ